MKSKSQDLIDTLDVMMTKFLEQSRLDSDITEADR